MTITSACAFRATSTIVQTCSRCITASPVSTRMLVCRRGCSALVSDPTDVLSARRSSVTRAAHEAATIRATVSTGTAASSASAARTVVGAACVLRATSAGRERCRSKRSVVAVSWRGAARDTAFPPTTTRSASTRSAYAANCRAASPTRTSTLVSVPPTTPESPWSAPRSDSIRARNRLAGSGTRAARSPNTLGSGGGSST